MTTEHDPCGMCDRFTPDSPKDVAGQQHGHCSGYDKPALTTDHPCVLFNERGTWATRQRQQAIARDQFPRDRKVAAKA